MSTSLLERYRGCLLGLACGDALGTSVEFMPRGSFTPLTDMLGGGPFGLRAGQWTDDTSMALCLAESLLCKSGFDARDQMARYLNWWQWGYLSSTGECFDIGMTVRDALTRFQLHGEPFAGSPEPNTAGNGSLMRLAPVVLFYHPDRAELLARCADSSRTTHAAPEAVECCRLFGLILSDALSGATRAELLQQDPTRFDEPAVAALARGDYLARPAEQIVGSGYSVASLTAALWCFQHSDSFEAAVLLAANLGDDADTTAAITGQLAGAYYGVQGIPAHWLARLHMHDDIQQTADQLLRAAQARGLAAIIEQPACGQILLAEQDGRVLGMVSLLYSQSTALGAAVAWLEDMVVDAGCRTGGIGSALLTAARDLAVSHGCRRITLLTDADNQAAQCFHARQGFSASSMLPMRLLLD